MLRVENVAHRFQGTVALDALAPNTFQIGEGEFVCIIGPSGCGKSTLPRIIAGLLVPTQGTVMLDSVPIRGPQRRIGLVFQQSNLMPWRTVIDNLVLPLELAGVSLKERYAQ